MLLRALILLLFLFGSASCGTLIRFLDRAEVPGNEILLSHVAQISGDNKEFFDSLKVGNSSGPGMRRYFCGEQVLVHTFIPDSIRIGMRISGAVRTEITTQGVSVSYSNFEDEIRRLLADSLPWKHYKVEFSNKEDQSLFLYDGEYTLHLKRVQSRYKRGRTQLTLEVVQDAWQTRFTMGVDIRVSERVAVSKRDIKRGEKIFASDVTYKLLDISELPYEPITPGFSFKRTEVDGYLRKGQVLSENRIKRQADIARGSEVRILYKNGKVSISTMGRARQDGRIGDIILVENNKSHKVIKGKVIKPGLVVIQSGGSV